MEDIFLRLQEVKNDTEQRNWTVHDDEEMIISLLTRLNDSLQTCDRNVSLYVMRKRKYDYILTLVEYFQVGKLVRDNYISNKYIFNFLA